MVSAFVVAVIAAAIGQPAGPEYKLGISEKVHGLTLKSGSAKSLPNSGKSQSGHAILLEFTRDITGKDLENTRKAFRVVLHQVKDKAEKTDAIVHFFDADNVVLATSAIEYREGQITGRKGDAFRIFVPDQPSIASRIRKIEIRQVDFDATFDGAEGRKPDSK
jgi:hypothetical protein